MFKFVTCILLILFGNFERARSTETVSVFALMRHGARAPFTPPDTYYKAIGALKPYDLTAIGIKEHILLGRYFRTRFRYLDPRDTIFYASESERCIRSMLAFSYEYLQGEDNGKRKILDMSFFKPKDYTKFNAYQMKRLNRQKHNINRLYNDSVVAGLPDAIRAYCPACKRPETLYDKLSLMKKIKSIYYCNTMNSVPVSHIRRDILPFLEAAGLTLSAIEFIKYRYAVNSARNMFRLLGKFLLLTMGRAYKDQDPSDPFANLEAAPGTFIFAHNHNIMAFLVVLLGPKKVFQDNYFLPEFAATAVIETFRIKGKKEGLKQVNGYQDGKIYVRFLYRFKDIKLHFCRAEYCTVDELITFIDKLYKKNN